MLAWALWTLVGCVSPTAEAPVLVQLSDGQVLSGALRTDVLVLDGGLGRLVIPLEDVGEVVPADAAHLAASRGHVTVWLRDGSELVGQWQAPELAMSIEVGGEDVAIDLPTDRLVRLQTRASERWPAGEAYRVHTAFGDDFLVDATRTRLVLEGEMGRFSPTLAECTSARPVAGAAGDWRVELTNGNVLMGRMVDQQITFAMAEGPSTIAVPLDRFAWMERVYFPGVPTSQTVGAGGGIAEFRRTVPEMAPAPAAAPVGGGWFDNGALRSEKARQAVPEMN